MAIYHESFEVESINGMLHVLWHDSDGQDRRESIDPGSTSFPNGEALKDWVKEFAKAYNAGIDTQIAETAPVINQSVQDVIGDVVQI